MRSLRSSTRPSLPPCRPRSRPNRCVWRGMWRAGRPLMALDRVMTTAHHGAGSPRKSAPVHRGEMQVQRAALSRSRCTPPYAGRIHVGTKRGAHFQAQDRPAHRRLGHDRCDQIREDQVGEHWLKLQHLWSHRPQRRRPAALPLWRSATQALEGGCRRHHCCLALPRVQGQQRRQA